MFSEIMALTWLLQIHLLGAPSGARTSRRTPPGELLESHRRQKTQIRGCDRSGSAEPSYSPRVKGSTRMAVLAGIAAALLLRGGAALGPPGTGRLEVCARSLARAPQEAAVVPELYSAAPDRAAHTNGYYMGGGCADFDLPPGRWIASIDAGLGEARKTFLVAEGRRVRWKRSPPEPRCDHSVTVTNAIGFAKVLARRPSGELVDRGGLNSAGETGRWSLPCEPLNIIAEPYWNEQTSVFVRTQPTDGLQEHELRTGATCRTRLTVSDPSGQPIDDVEAHVLSVAHPVLSPRQYSPQAEHLDGGELSVSACADRDGVLRVQAPGYAAQEFPLPDSDESRSVTLTPSRQLTGVVLGTSDRVLVKEWKPGTEDRLCSRLGEEDWACDVAGPGPFRVVAFCEGAGASTFWKEATLGQPFELECRPPGSAPPRRPNPPEPQRDSTSELTVEAVDASGRAISHASIAVWRVGGAPIFFEDDSVLTDGTGSTPPWKSLEPGTWRAYGFAGFDPAPPVTFQLAAGETTTQRLVFNRQGGCQPVRAMYRHGRPILTYVLFPSKAWQAGLRPGMEVIAVGGVPASLLPTDLDLRFALTSWERNELDVELRHSDGARRVLRYGCD